MQGSGALFPSSATRLDIFTNINLRFPLQTGFNHQIRYRSSWFVAFQDEVAVYFTAFKFVDDPFKPIIIFTQIRIIHLIRVSQTDTLYSLSHSGKKRTTFSSGHILYFINNNHRPFDVHASDISKGQ